MFCPGTSSSIERFRKQQHALPRRIHLFFQPGPCSSAYVHHNNQRGPIPEVSAKINVGVNIDEEIYPLPLKLLK